MENIVPKQIPNLHLKHTRTLYIGTCLIDSCGQTKVTGL